MKRISLFGRSTPSLYHPGSVPRLTIVVGVHVRQSRSVRCFPSWDERIGSEAPDAIAANLALLRELAVRILDGRAPALPLRHSLTVFTSPGDELNPVDRELLWRAFAVPVFEQRLDGQGRLVAFECEAHDGLHLTGTARVAALLTGRWERCACGKLGPKLSCATEAPSPETTMAALRNT